MSQLNIGERDGDWRPQTRQQTSGRDLYVFTVELLALKKLFFSLFRGQKKVFEPFFRFFIMQVFSADAMVFSKKNLKNFFDPEKLKKTLKKVAHNRPKPFYSTVQPRPTAHSPKLIFHIMKSRDQRSVLLSVVFCNEPYSIIILFLTFKEGFCI